MSRRRLWALTFCMCALFVVAATPPVREAGHSIRVATNVALTNSGIDLAAWCLVGGVAAIVIGLTLRSLRRRDDLGLGIRRRMHRGRSIAAIARELGLPQDLVRDLAGPVLSRPTERKRSLVTRGTEFRVRPAAAAERPDRFVDVLRATLSRGTR